MMASPEGSLTAAQFEILQLLWGTPGGLSIAEIWAGVCKEREVRRTTVSNLVDRLEKRNWLIRKKIDGVFRYQPTAGRESTERKLAAEFVGEFFNGSASSFVLSLLGSDRLSRVELNRLKTLLDDSKSSKK